jgi:hypothetical protein
MNQLHLRYLVITLVATALLSIGVQVFIMTLLSGNNVALAGAALAAGWWMNVIAAGIVGILAGRKSAARFTDPRLGRVAGAGIGLWVGIGAVIGLIVFVLALAAQVPNSGIRPGLIFIFGLISLAVSVIAASIAGRETAHPPELEEEA